MPNFFNFSLKSKSKFKISLGLSFILLFPLFNSWGKSDWKTASRESAGLAPGPQELDSAIFQIYTARAYNWRGYLAVHPWVAWKLKEEDQYTVAHVTAWGLRRGGSAITMEQDIPDRHWFGNVPSLMYQARGLEAEKIIQRIKELIQLYPYKNTYRLWPGPNSNTFVSYLIRHTPELKTELPSHAIGKDWLVQESFLAKSPSKSGFQVSLFGILGMTLGLNEGIEMNVLSLNFGVDFLTPALKLPFFGRVGLQDKFL